jgi:hypothetical protein
VSVLLITWPGSRPACSWGPAAAGYGQDQRWILARVVALIATMFHLRVSVTTAWQAMRRLGYSAQLLIHRAIERDEQAIVHWRRYLSVTGGERVAARASACICFADECGQALKAYKATTWAPKGVTPVVKVTAKGTVRVSVAGLCCYRPGQPSRLIYRTLLFAGVKASRRGSANRPDRSAGRRPPAITSADRAGLGRPVSAQKPGDALSDRRPLIAAGLPASVLRARAQPGREGLVDDERQPADLAPPSWPLP